MVLVQTIGALAGDNKKKRKKKKKSEIRYLFLWIPPFKVALGRLCPSTEGYDP